MRVNVVAPGATDTAMIDRFAGSEEVKQQLLTRVPLRRLATTEEVANAVLFIASDQASFITGVSLLVDCELIEGLCTHTPNTDNCR